MRTSSHAPKQTAYVRPLTRGERMAAFIETLPVPDGELQGQKIRLAKHQLDFLLAVYDVLDERGRRRIRQAIQTIARKNGKTTFIAGIVLGHLAGPECVYNAQIYSAAYERDQAALVYKSAAGMIRMDDELGDLLHCTDSGKRILHPLSGSVYKALSKESKSKHGFNPTVVIFDELAQYGENRELYDVLITSFGAQAEPLMCVIGTQADTDAAVLSQLIDYGQQVMAGTVEDSSFYLQQFSVPVDADIYDERVWPLANPALGLYRSLEEMRSFARRAKMLPSLERTFRNLYLNQRVQSATVFISPGVWKANAGYAERLTREQWALLADKLKGKECYAGLDLSGKVDLTALVLVFPLRNEDANLISPDFPYSEIVVLPFFWTPRDTILERTKKDKVPYFEWWQQGYLEAPQGFAINYGHVAERIAQLATQFTIKGIAADRWNLTQLKARLVEHGYKEQELEKWIVPHGQGFKDMSPAVNVLEEALLGSRLRHGLHPVLTYNAASAVVDKDPAENRKFFKNKSAGRIDGVVALAMALNLAIGSVKKRAARGITTL